MGVLELEAMTYIRGRSIPNQFIIVDDAQNVTPQQAATIITRAGEGSKVVFLGDVNKQQIDNHRLTPNNNGLVYVIDKFRGASDIIGHMAMNCVVRSELADLAVKLL
jgi:PhoH-like ATPase